MIPIQSDEDYDRTKAYAAHLETMLREMRRTMTPEQYEWMSRSFIKELSLAFKDMARYLARLPEPGESHAEPAGAPS